MTLSSFASSRSLRSRSSDIPIRDGRDWMEFIRPTLDAASIITSLVVIQWSVQGFFGEIVLATGLIAVIVFLLTSHLTGLQRGERSFGANDEIINVVCTWGLTILVLAFLAFLSRQGDMYPRSVIVVWTLLCPAMIGLSRMSLRIVRSAMLRRGVGVRRVAIAGYNSLGLQTRANILSEETPAYQFSGIYDDRTPLRLIEDLVLGNQAGEIKVSGTFNDLVVAAREGRIETVLLTLPMRAEDRIRSLLDQLSDTTASVYIVPDFFVFELLHARWTRLGGLPAVSIFENPLSGMDGAAKRITDVVLAVCGLIVLAIPMSIIAIAIKLTSPGPVFFRQRRYGLDGQEIRVWKFRSMRTCDDGAVVRQATKGDPRITRLGAILRRTSLDELPQLFNVIDGSMSLVGPRPHATAHNEQYRREIRGYMLRHKIKPGITGLAQVSGCRGETETIEKMQARVHFDHIYIRTWSLWLDIKILFRTLWVAWKQPEAY